jgi:integral membrane sensor domain MASE1/DNA-binding CsgD family transcriptional regulator/GAF domain-containing protein
MGRQVPSASSLGVPEKPGFGARGGHGFSPSFLSAEDLAKLAGVGIAYFVLAFAGLQLASIHPSATPIWAPTGLAIAAILLWGYRVALAVFFAAFAINALFTATTLTSLAIACGNTLEAVTAGYLIRSLIGHGNIFDTPTTVAKFLCACLVATTISATIGVCSLIFGGQAEAAAFWPIWLTWWLGDLAGALIVAPVVLLWVEDHQVLASPLQICRTTATYVVSAAIAFVCFSPLLQDSAFRDVLAFFVVLPLLWAAVRQGPRDTATAALIISTFAVWGTQYHGGPFDKPSGNSAFLVLLVFLISLVVPALALSAEVSTRRRLETKQRQRSLKAEVLWQASVQAAQGGSFVELLRTCLQKICQIAGWAAGHVYTPDNIDDPDCLRSSGVWHFEGEALEGLVRDATALELRRGQGLPGRIWATGKPIWMSDLRECDNLPRKDLLLRRGFRAAFGFPIYTEGKLQAVLEFFSTTRRGPDENLMRIVQSIGEQLGRVIERKQAKEKREALETTLNALALAVYLIDRAARVVYMNRAAEQQLQNGGGLRLEANQLVPVDCNARAEFMKAIDLVTESASSPPLNDTIIPIPEEEGPGLIATILSLNSIELEGASRTLTAAAAVFVQDSAVPTISMGEAFAQLYGLTKSELRVLLAMSPDLSLKQVAERLGISETTAKTHLQHVYAKTHTSRQSELIHLFLCFTPPLVDPDEHQLSETRKDLL